MIRRLLRFLLPSGLVLATVLLLRRTKNLRQETTGVVPSPDPWPPIPESLPPALSVAAWAEPLDGACPPTHPIKAKAASGIYHLPGMLNYDRTKPDRCYADESAASADGFTKAKR
ncbi:MAG: hypothetical protein M3083_03965 [Actinomycetota bacterium]|nr:hypothetical protein [Actinomycetota bacterium]